MRTLAVRKGESVEGRRITIGLPLADRFWIAPDAMHRAPAILVIHPPQA